MNKNHENNYDKNDGDDILILSGNDVITTLAGRELEVMRAVQRAYEVHAQVHTSLPHSTFLRFPEDPANRIIALPAFLGDEFQTAGIKWIASFPGNRDAGLDRASAILILNSALTGRPQAMLEGSIISAKRTAASAALAARYLHDVEDDRRLGLIGCGPINLEIARFLLADRPNARSFLLFDVQPERARQFKAKLEELSDNIDVAIAEGVDDVLGGCPLLSFATTAIEPHINDLSLCHSGATILHISLRDLAPKAILSCENIVDDVSHVLRAQTSVHLTELQVGNQNFIGGTLADVMAGKVARSNAKAKVVFSPFGLGILDLAVGKLVCDVAKQERRGQTISSFLPDSWLTRQETVLLGEQRG